MDGFGDVTGTERNGGAGVGGVDCIGVDGIGGGVDGGAGDVPAARTGTEGSVAPAVLLARAERLARQRHAGQVDKAGAPYWRHPMRVSAACASPEGRIAGWLHDLLEDTDTTPDELSALGFPPAVVAAVDLDTRRDGEPYMDYIGRIVAACGSSDPRVATAGRIAREVKLADLRDNMDLGRLPAVTEADLRRCARYRRARRILEESQRTSTAVSSASAASVSASSASAVPSAASAS